MTFIRLIKNIQNTLEINFMTSRSLGKVYVTGADGFIGSHLVESLVQDGHQVTALCVYNSIGSYGWLNHLAVDPPKNLKLLLGDVRDRELMHSSIAGHHTVFHLASLIAIPYSYQAPQSYLDTNATGTMNIANACLHAKVERMIHTSTSEVYGTARYVPINEEHPLQGQSPYSASKIAADMIVESFQRSFNLPAVTLRPFNTYGPRQSMRAVIPTVIAQVLAAKSEISLGSLSPTRDFNYVDDTVAAFRAVAETSSEALIGQVFNAGSGREVTIGEMVDLVLKLLDREVNIIADDQRVRPVQSEVERLLCDSSKLRSLADWRPFVSLEEGLKRTIDWTLKNAEMLQRAEAYHR